MEKFKNIKLVEDDYTLTSDDDVILVDTECGDVDIILPENPADGMNYTIKKIDNSLYCVVIETENYLESEIDGRYERLKLKIFNESVTIIAFNDNWYVI
jgi:hypothetical protein